MRAASRITGHSLHTIHRILEQSGAACAAYQAKVFRNLPIRRIELDEIWGFCYCKQRQVEGHRSIPGVGDTYTWTAICADTRLVPAWLVGERDEEHCHQFVADLATRLRTHRIQITTDGLMAYIDAIDCAFGGEADYARIVKQYNARGRYKGSRTEVVSGQPEKALISTSYVESHNATIRERQRRLGRKSRAFSKKLENFRHAMALHFMSYNFGFIHKTLKTTPAIAMGIEREVWTPTDIADLID